MQFIKLAEDKFAINGSLSNKLILPDLSPVVHLC
jgi:hypothetical protein